MKIDKSRKVAKQSLSNLKLFTKVCVPVVLISSSSNLRLRLKTHVNVVRRARFFLSTLDSRKDNVDHKCFDKMQELDSLLYEMELIMYDTNECEPAAEACIQLTYELFRNDILRLIILCLPKLNLKICVEVRADKKFSDHMQIPEFDVATDECYNNL
ncbi:hypothetical protein RND71_029596 [Anisodus tanguticus]|uniref:Uncharacterized protein n=1 Tax=Anisodus tanguticus TaxID=243964 RepID=A0AAE1RFT0_9SOLA|nr:hypothetical protein RND71_029596 [Anisodus tanguticus]